MKILISNILFIFFFMIAFYSCSKQNDSAIQFTSEEINWINSNNKIILAIDDANIPLNYSNNDGELVGYNVDLLKLLENKLGFEIHLVPSEWQLAIKKAISFEVDGIVNADSTEKRGEKLLFTDGLFNNPKTLICSGTFRKSDSLSNFTNYKIAATINTSHYENLLDVIPDSNIISVRNMSEAFDLLQKGRVQCIFNDFTPLQYRINQLQIENVNICYIESAGSKTRIGIRNDKPILISILNKGINQISEEEKRSLLNRWISKDVQ